MSRAYNIPIRACDSRTVVGEDEVSSALDLIPILPPEQMGQILLDELQKRGYQLDPCGTSVSKDTEGVTIQVGLDGVVSAKVSVSNKIETEAVVNVRTDTDYDNNPNHPGYKRRLEEIEKAKEQVAAALDKKFKDAQDGVRATATAKLEGALRGLKAELDEVVGETLAVALEKKAATLGEIVEKSKTPDGGLVIRVSV